MPQRIQRRRTKGWRMPGTAIYVGRPSHWGNPFLIEEAIEADYRDPRRACVSHYRAWMEGAPEYEDVIYGHDRRELREALHDLRSWDLACWCPLGQPCHADVLLELANGGDADA